jgi:hypothetical protein
MGKPAVVSRNVLVVSTVEHPERALRGQLSDADELKVIVPVVRQGFLDWLAMDERARSEAEASAERTAEVLPGEVVDARAGEADVSLAIQDALATFPADEILLVTRPEDEAGWLEQGQGEEAERTYAGLPLRHVVVSEP